MTYNLRDITRPQLLSSLGKRPGMYVPGGTYDGVVGMIIGYDIGRKDEPSVLDAFIESYIEENSKHAFTVIAAAEALGVEPSEVPRQLTSEQDRACTSQLTGDMLTFIDAQG